MAKSLFPFLIFVVQRITFVKQPAENSSSGLPRPLAVFSWSEKKVWETLE
jgi:hypothetical protein